MQPVVQVEMSRQVKLVADKSIQDAAHDSYDAIALPVWSSAHRALQLRNTSTTGMVIKLENQGRQCKCCSVR